MTSTPAPTFIDTLKAMAHERIDQMTDFGEIETMFEAVCGYTVKDLVEDMLEDSSTFTKHADGTYSVKDS